jgi:phosphoglycolate phosphatase
VSSPRRLIVCDLDGTLVDSGRDIATAVNLARADAGLAALPADVVVGFIGNGARELVRRAHEGTGVDTEVALGRYRAHYEAHLTDTTVLHAGVAEALVRLRERGAVLAVCSNKPRGFCVELLRRLGVVDHFDAVLGGDSTTRVKPDPEPLLVLMNRFGIGPLYTWMVGDHYTDVRAGKAAGAHTCFVHGGIGEARGEVADLVVDHFADFAARLLDDAQ